MFQQDYIMRLVQQLSIVLGKLIELKEAGDDNAIFEYINESYRSGLKIHPDEIDRLSPEELIPFLENNQLDHPAQLNFLGHLLKEQGEILHKKNKNIAALSNFQKALVIFRFLNENDDTFDWQRMEAIRFLNKNIKILQ